MTYFVSVLGRGLDALPSYIYEGQSIIDPHLHVMTGECRIVKVEGTKYMAQYLADRLHSNMWGATIHESLQDAVTKLEEYAP